MRICLINKSTKYSAVQIGLAAIASALNWQAGHATPALNVGVRPTYALAAPGRDDLLMNFYDNSEQEGALGDHFEEGGKPVMEVFIEPIIASGGGMGNQANSVSACASHEALEALINPRINRWADMPNGDDVALEESDPVENDAYFAPNGIAVSNFVLAPFFDPEATHPEKFDWMGKLTAPFQNRGYMVIRTESGKVSDVFAKAEKKGHKGHELCECRETGKTIVVVGPSVEKMSAHKLNKLVAKFMRNGEKIPSASPTFPNLDAEGHDQHGQASQAGHGQTPDDAKPVTVPFIKDDGTVYFR